MTTVATSVASRANVRLPAPLTVVAAPQTRFADVRAVATVSVADATSTSAGLRPASWQSYGVAPSTHRASCSLARTLRASRPAQTGDGRVVFEFRAVALICGGQWEEAFANHFWKGNKLKTS